MLWSIGIAESHSLLLVVHKNEIGVDKCLLCNLVAWECCKLYLEFLLYLMNHILRSRDKDNLRVDTVLSL